MRFSALFIGVGIAALSATSAFAQTAPAVDQAADTAAEESGDIVVTAQRRAERLQDVPISISVVGEEQLERQQITQLNDLTRTTASLQINSVGGGGGGGSAFIRGIGTASLARSAESAVGIVVDGVVQGNTNISNLFDIGRVEVLRGPQGTLFGQSVSAGVINIATIAPDPSRVSGKVSVQLAGDGFAGSEFGRQIVRGAVNLPVSETSALRVSGQFARMDGILRNTLKRKDDELKDITGRVRYRGEFGAVTANIIADYSHSRGTDGQFFTKTTILGPENAVQLNLCGIVVKPGNLKHCSGAREVQTRKSYGGSAQFDIDLGNIVVTSITARRFQDMFVNGDIDRLPQPPAVGLSVSSGVQTDYSQFTQELRMSINADAPLSATVGAFYYDADTFFSAGPQEGGFTIIPTGAIVGNVELADAEVQNVSGFGEMRYKSGPITVFAGGRITKARLTQEGTRQQTSPVVGAILRSNIVYKDTDFSWRVGGQYAPSRDFQVYGSVARGYKNAQIAPIAIINNVPVLGTVVRPEKPIAYELGFKSTVADGRLSFNLAGFYQRVKNFQAQTASRDPLTQVISVLPLNIGKVISRGVEADAFGRISDNLTINASAIYNVAKYPSTYLARNGAPLGGEQIAFAPRFSATVSGEYTQPLSGDVEGFLSLDLSHRGKTRLTDERLEDSITTDRARWTFGGRIGARVDDRWSVAIFASNIGASRLAGSIAGLAAQPGSTYAFGRSYGPQSLRQIGLQADLEF